MICCSCGKEIDINYGREYWNGIYCKKCADEMLSTPEYIKNYKRIIAGLQAENAALRERLEKAVELPVKIGDTVYCVNDEDCHYVVETTTVTQENFYLLCSRIKGNPSDAFLSREAAEARLKELQGGKDE